MSIGQRYFLIAEKYLLVYLLVGASAFPFFGAIAAPLLSVVFVYTALRFAAKRLSVPKFLIKVLLFLTFLVVVQTVKFGHFSVVTTLSLYIRWTVPLIVILLAGGDFLKTYIKMIYFFCWVSFAFFAPSVFIPGFEAFLLENVTPIFRLGEEGEYSSNLIIYTINSTQFNFAGLRNSGPFWEPGAFAGYTLIAYIFNLLSNRNFVSVRNIVFLLAILTSMSTAGILALTIFLFFYFLVLQKNRVGWLLAPAIVGASYFAIISTDTFYVKLSNASGQLFSNQESDAKRSRVVSAKLDLIDVYNNPLVGKGRSEITRFGTENLTYLEHRNNGVTDFLVKYGIPFSLFYFFFMTKSFGWFLRQHNLRRSFSLLILIVILTIGFAETYFQQGFFIALFYLHAGGKINDIG